jgi:hypothetical protein
VTLRRWCVYENRRFLSMFVCPHNRTDVPTTKGESEASVGGGGEDGVRGGMKAENRHSLSVPSTNEIVFQQLTM